MICSDLLFHGARSWAEPQIVGRNLSQEEELRFVVPLRFQAKRILHEYPNVQDVVVVDQLPPGTIAATAPFNMHANRL